MLNLWIQTEQAFATWVCDLESLREEPDAAVATLLDTIRLGELHGVFVPQALPRLGFRPSDASVAELLHEQWLRHGTADLGALDDPAGTVTATLSLYDSKDQLVEKPVADLGAELRALEPAPDAIPPGCTRSFPPVRLLGLRIERDSMEKRGILPPTLRIAVHSDIWFPFVLGGAHPMMDGRRLFDNRELATRDTPRLNAFLRDAAAVVRRAGGRWYLAADESAPLIAPWTTDLGIDINGPTPELMPASALSAEWW